MQLDERKKERREKEEKERERERKKKVDVWGLKLSHKDTQKNT